jgi:hypothetical protein
MISQAVAAEYLPSFPFPPFSTMSTLSRHRRWIVAGCNSSVYTKLKFMFLRKSLHDINDRVCERYYNTYTRNRDVVARIENQGGKARDLFLLDKALLMSLFAFDVILLSALYVTIVLMAK